MSIPGRTVRLRAVEEADLPQLQAWANDEALWSNLGGWRFPTSFDSIRTWFAGLKSDPANLRLVIEALEGGALLGTANLVDIDWKNRHATHGVMLGDPAMHGRGYGFDTVMAVMRYAFDELNLERLDSDIIEYNQPSYRLYVGKCGWTEEGRQRRWHFRQGRYWDKILIGVTRDDYAALARSSGYWT
ncbi:MAG: GNAT family N-acetyltransferase [Phenylobacterium sp. SCN 69-14]|nr:MAG: GNAT family N-acetyltransferase [Phenylobacterium sp. SCN 69-14]